MQFFTSAEALIAWQNTQTKRKHRTLCCLCGTETASMAWAQNFLKDVESNQVLYGPQSTSKDYLGQNFSYIIFNAWQGFHPDYFCSMIDCLEGGGIFFLLIPTDMDAWLKTYDPEFKKFAHYSDQTPKPRFLSRFIYWLQNSNDNIGQITVEETQITVEETTVKAITSELNRSVTSKLADKTPAHLSTTELIQPNIAQSAFLDFVISQLTYKTFSINLTANRGRGKSFALGLLIGTAF